RIFNRGDGEKSPRNSNNRRLDTGNAAINSPEFLDKEFFIVDNRVNIDGIAEPDSEVDIYRVEIGTGLGDVGALSEKITTVNSDKKGKFSATLTDIRAGEIISGISTHPKYGTSEPADNALIRNLGDSRTIQNQKSPIQNSPECVTRPKPPEPEPALEPIPEPVPIRLQVPRTFTLL
ncbi:MAG: cell envelope biogenesis protein OmpA, partial [Calothrix sp. SM1_7_51]|nr:cell envelope biogenesis protein OmpA [Calothrix sp. SM1_7_51]